MIVSHLEELIQGREFQYEVASRCFHLTAEVP